RRRGVRRLYRQPEDRGKPMRDILFAASMHDHGDHGHERRATERTRCTNKFRVPLFVSVSSVVLPLLMALAMGVMTPATRLIASDPGGSGDWPMWGGTPDRNMVSNMKGLPIDWDVKTKKNVKWVAELGSQRYR